MSTIPHSFIEELRLRLPPSQWIGKKVALKSKNGRAHIGLCPFHKEKTPSFNVDDNKGFYHCFGCGTHGDVISFVMQDEGLSFVDAIERLASEAGMSVPRVANENKEEQQQRNTLFEVTEAACSWFQARLQHSDAAHAREYLKKRGIDQSTIEKFRIGFAPNARNSIKKALANRHVQEQMLIDTGLLIKPDSGESYDRFRGRIIFPIADKKNRVVAFGGRILGEGQPKYLNSPETPLFQKSNILYNEFYARTPAFKTRQLVVTEGYMDVIALDRAGIESGVAPLGTALTEQHLQKIWSLCPTPTLCFDGDQAGIKAMVRTIDMALPHVTSERSVNIALLPAGMDPDDVIREQGAEALKGILRQALSLSEALWRIESTKQELKTPEKIAALENRLMQHVARLKDKTIASHYRSFFRNNIWQPKKRQKPSSSPTGFAASTVRVDSKQECEYLLCAMVWQNPALLSSPAIAEEFTTIEWQTEALNKVREPILEWLSEDPEAATQQIKDSAELKEVFAAKHNGKALEQYALTLSEKEYGWEYVCLHHHLCLLKQEHKEALVNVSQDTEPQVQELQKQMLEIKKKINKMQGLLGQE